MQELSSMCIDGQGYAKQPRARNNMCYRDLSDVATSLCICKGESEDR